VSVEIEDFGLCPRYSALAVNNIEVTSAPLWLQARLESVGLNSINSIVDLTNYVLAELPQPMHAFDADKLKGGVIYVRLAREGEKLVALNGETYQLHPADLVIADAAGPIALAGVIGGADSAISTSTTRVIFESANFKASSVRLTSARHKLRTDASMRFEKAIDPENTVRGIARLLALLGEISPQAQITGGVCDVRSLRPLPEAIDLPVVFVGRKLGKEVSQDEIVGILTSLGFGVTASSDGADLRVTVPSWRATKDISLRDDLVEEIGRIIGYAEIVPKPPLVASTVPPANALRSYLRQLRSRIAAQGFTEVANYSFVSEADVAPLSMEIDRHIAVRNPIAAELSHLRTSLLPGLFKNILTNVRHFHEFRFFELGNEIHPASSSERGALPEEIPHLAAALYSQHGSEDDFFELKRVTECLWPGVRLEAGSPRPYEHPVRNAEAHWRGVLIGRLFELHPSLLQKEGIAGRAVILDVDLSTAHKVAAQQLVAYRSLRKYPTSGFDLSIIAALRQPVAHIEDQLRALGGEKVARIEFVGQYAGPQLPEGQKSVSYHIEAGALDHTLTAEEASEVRTALIAGMRAHGYELRV
jgi:phenylalanyl-tRNA synthetase beta chain